MDKLQSKYMTNDNRPALINELEAIDCALHDAMITDVSKGIHTSPTWWSPDLRNEKLGVSYWELRRVQRITGMCMAQAIQNILDQLPPDYPLQDKLHTSNIEAMIRRSKLRVRDAVRHSFDLRQQFLIQLHTEYDTAGEEEKARQITALKNNELKQMSYRKIKRYIKSIEPTQLTYVDVESNGSTTRVTQKKDLEETLLAHHKQHFSQAADTPFAQPEVLQRFGIAADTEYAIAFRQGDNREFTQWKDSFTRNFLEYIQPAPNDPPKIDAKLDVEHVKTGFRIWSKKTTTSPAGRVLPLYKL